MIFFEQAPQELLKKKLLVYLLLHDILACQFLYMLVIVLNITIV